MKRPKSVNSIVTNKNWISSKVILLTLEHIKPETVSFEPGQFISLKVGEEEYRVYSICSDKKDTRRLDIIVEAKHMGLGASYVRNIKLGDVITFIGPSGRLRLKEPLKDNLYFFSTGTGIAPFISMFFKLNDLEYTGSIRLFQGIRYKYDMLFRSRLEEFSNVFRDFQYNVYASKESKADKINSGRITSVFNDFHPEKESHFFICGNPHMVADVKNNLLNMGISEKDISYEGFTYAV